MENVGDMHEVRIPYIRSIYNGMPMIYPPPKNTPTRKKIGTS